MQVTVRTAAAKIAGSLGMSEETLFQQALVSFLHQQKREVLQHRLDILARYGADSVETLETRIAQGEVVEHPAWEDLIVAENLAARQEELDAYLDDLQGAEQNRARSEFSDVVVAAQNIMLPTGDPLKLRLDRIDGSLLDVFISVSERYSYHWERRLIVTGSDVYRHDNAPHGKWGDIGTFPKHFHDGSENHVVESHLSDVPEEAMREFLTFVRQKLLKQM